jgi:hypothetical protein
LLEYKAAVFQALVRRWMHAAFTLARGTQMNIKDTTPARL